MRAEASRSAFEGALEALPAALQLLAPWCKAPLLSLSLLLGAAASEGVPMRAQVSRSALQRALEALPAALQLLPPRPHACLPRLPLQAAKLLMVLPQHRRCCKGGPASTQLLISPAHLLVDLAGRLGRKRKPSSRQQDQRL